MKMQEGVSKVLSRPDVIASEAKQSHDYQEIACLSADRLRRLALHSLWQRRVLLFAMTILVTFETPSFNIPSTCGINLVYRHEIKIWP